MGDVGNVFKVVGAVVQVAPHLAGAVMDIGTQVAPHAVSATNMAMKGVTDLAGDMTNLGVQDLHDALLSGGDMNDGGGSNTNDIEAGGMSALAVVGIQEEIEDPSDFIIRDVFEILKSKTENTRGRAKSLLAGLPHLVDKDDVFAYLDGCTEDVIVVRKELITVKGEEQLTSRVFVRLRNFVYSYDVGWIVADDVGFCMVCSDGFGFFKHRHHCYACGGVFCATCTENKVNMSEYPDDGEVSICQLCFYGQSEISVCHHPHIVASIASVDSDDSGGFSSRPPVVRRHSSAARLSALENTRLRVKSDAEDLAALIVTNRRRSQDDECLIESSGDFTQQRSRSATHTGHVAEIEHLPGKFQQDIDAFSSTATQDEVSESDGAVKQFNGEMPRSSSAPLPATSSPSEEEYVETEVSSPSKHHPASPSFKGAVRRLSSSLKRSATHDGGHSNDPSSSMSPMHRRTFNRRQPFQIPPLEDIVIDGKPATYAGYLMKLGSTSLAHMWQSRFFVLTENTLRYYNDHCMTEEASEKRTTIIGPTTKINVEDTYRQRGRFTIEIVDRILEIKVLLRTDSEEAKDKWVHHLSSLYQKPPPPKKKVHVQKPLPSYF